MKIEEIQEEKKIEETPKEEVLPDKGLTPTVDNGYDFGHYKWTQNARDVTLYLPLPDSIKGKDLFVDIHPTTIKVVNKIKNETMFEGELFGLIKAENSTWLINNDTTRELVIELDKKKFDDWWGGIRKSDPEIDLSKVRPPNAHISDLDQETRATIGKMMHEQEEKEKAGFYKDQKK